MSEVAAPIEKDEFTIEEKLKYGIVGVVVLGAAFFLGRKLIREAKANTEEKKTYEEGSAATFAKQIRMAFENNMWWGMGTDEEALRKTVLAIPSKDEFKKVINSYQKLYARSMMADMQDELTTSEYNEMLAIVATKPERGVSHVQLQLSIEQYQSWAKRLRAAFEVKSWGFLPGTDEDAIKTVFMEIPTQTAFLETAKVYQSLFGDELIADLRSELEVGEAFEMNAILEKKPK